MPFQKEQADLPRASVATMLEKQTKSKQWNVVIDPPHELILGIEQAIQADYGYRPGLNSIAFVPLEARPGEIPHPIQVLNYPIRQADEHPENRAIAKIGQVWMYWDIVTQAAKRGVLDYYDYNSLVMTPIFITPDGEFRMQKIAYTQNMHHAKTASYSHVIGSINYGGDADFSGAYSPPENIPVYLVNDERAYVPYETLGITRGEIYDMFFAAKRQRKTHGLEVTEYIKQSLHELPGKEREIVELAIKSGDTLEGYQVLRPLFYDPRLNDEVLINSLMAHLTQIVNREFKRNIETNQFIRALGEFTQSLDTLYQHALASYKP